MLGFVHCVQMGDIIFHEMRFESCKYIKNAFGAGDPPRTPLGSSQRSPRIPTARTFIVLFAEVV